MCNRDMKNYEILTFYYFQTSNFNFYKIGVYGYLCSKDFMETKIIDERMSTFLNSITILYILKIKGSNHFEFDTHVAGYKQCNYTTIRLLLKSLGI